MENEIKVRNIAGKNIKFSDFQFLKNVMEKEKRDIRFLNLSGDVIVENFVEEGIRSKNLTEIDFKKINEKTTFKQKNGKTG